MALRVVTIRWGDFPKIYVEALRRQVREHTGQELICLGDDVPLSGHYGGRWGAKIELFSPAFEPYRPCLFFDLDTFLMGPIDDLLEPMDNLWLIRDFNKPRRSNSGVMRVPKKNDLIWEQRPSKFDFADGNYLTDFPHGRIQDHFDGVVSYKLHSREAPTGRIVCFHGKPKPHEADGWARDYWKAYSS